MEYQRIIILDDPVFEIKQCHSIGKCKGWPSHDGIIPTIPTSVGQPPMRLRYQQF